MSVLKQWHMLSWAKKAKDLQTVRLYGDQYFYLNKKVAIDRCPHRGALLSAGKLVDNSVKCPYHNRYFSPCVHPDMFSGVIKDGALWYGGDNPDDIPRIPEFDDPSYRSIYMTRSLPGASAVAFLEAGIDFEHVKSVHSVSVTDIIPPSVDIDVERNVNTHIFETPRITLKIETLFWLPFTNCLKFSLADKKKNKQYEPFILFFSETPHDDKNTTLHIRSLRKKTHPDLDFFLDLFFIAVSDLPVLEDYNVVKNVDYKRSEFDKLTPEDNFIALYRKKMLEQCPDILDYFLK